MSSPPPPNPEPIDRTLPEHRTVELPPAASRQTPRPDGAGVETFPAEAASLLRHLNLAPPAETITGDRATPRTANSHPSSDEPRIPGYELLGELGRGGMGVVYKARQVTLNRIVALKTIHGGRVGERELARFLIEAEAVAAVEHPNVVRVYEYGECDGYPYTALEYLPGGTLADQLQRVGQLPDRDAAGLVAKVARGVAAAHNLRIVHRDLKPANILFQVESQNVESHKVDHFDPSDFATLRLDDLRPKVADFGLAKRGGSNLTQTQAVMGTPAYMAPEQADGKTKFVGPAADVWALGVILYECLHGERPFQADDVHVLLSLIRSGDLSAFTSRGAIPRELDLICRKCLEKNPADRYPTGAELADDLERFGRGEPVSVRPLGPVARGIRWAKRNPAVAGLLTLVLLSTLGLAASLFVQYRQALANADTERRSKETAEQLAASEAAAKEKAQKLAADNAALATDKAAEAERANKVSDFMTGLFRSSDPLDFFGDTLLPPNWEKQRSKTAEVLLREAAEKFRTELKDQPLTRARLLAAVGNSLTNLGDCKTAESLLRESLELRRAHLAADHPDVVKNELDLGRLYWHIGDFHAALDRFRSCLEVQRKSGATEAVLLTTRFYEALTLGFLQPEEADPIFREVIAGRDRLLGPNHQDTIAARLGYAALLLDLQRTGDLLKLMPELMSALRAQPDGQFQKIVDAFSAFQIGVGYAQQASAAPVELLGDFARKQAQNRLREALAKAEANMPPDHMLVGLIRYELAGVLVKAGKEEEADALYARVIADARKTVGLAHPKILVVVRNVGDRMASHDRLADARKLWDEVERANIERFGPGNHWLGVLQLGRVDFECRFGDLATAAKYAGQAVQLLRSGKVLPTREASQTVMLAGKQLARPGLSAANKATVRELFDFTRKFVTAAYGPKTREMGIALRVEGEELFRMGDRQTGAARLAEAEPLAPLLKKSDDEELRDLLAALGMVADRAGRFADAERYHTRALAISRKNGWPGDRVTDAWGLVRALAGQGKHTEMVKALEDIRRWKADAAEADRAWIDLFLAAGRFASGERETYRTDIIAMLEGNTKSTDVNTLARMAWAVGVSPATDPAAATGVAKRLSAALKQSPRFGWGHWALALASLRAGDLDGAETSLKAGGTTWNSREWAFPEIIAGLCAAKRGDTTAARSRLQKAEQIVIAEKPTEKKPFAYADTNWGDRYLTALLLAELRAAVDAGSLRP